MQRPLALVAGLAMLIAPNRIVESAQRLAFENPDTGRLRPQTIPIAQLEGVLFVWLLGRHPEHASVLKRPLAVLGLVIALVPRQALAVGLDLAYENPDELEVKSWVMPATRLLGACYLVVGLFAGRAGDSSEEASPSPNR